MNLIVAFCAAIGVAMLLLICICMVLICGDVRRINQACNEALDLLEREDDRQRRLLAFLRSRNFDPPPKNGH